MEHKRSATQPDIAVAASGACATRRQFLGGVSGAAAALAAGVPSLLGAPEAEAACEVGPLDPDTRADKALQIRIEAAHAQRALPIPPHDCNGDEDLYPGKIGNFSKGLLKANTFGEVNLLAYAALLHALETGRHEDFEAIPLGCPDSTKPSRKLVNPQAGLAFDMEGADSHHLAQPPAPQFASAWAAGEMVEDYWMALLRDTPFHLYPTDPLVAEAVDDLNRLSDFRGPKDPFTGKVTPQLLFRENVPGALVGPYISQFLYLPCPFGANFIEQRMLATRAGLNYGTTAASWLSIQQGCSQPADQFDVRRYMINGRDIGQWVHIDVLFQAYFHACLILGTPPGSAGGIGCPPNPTNPYVGSRTQDGFGTFGGPFFKTLMCEVATRALKAVWFEKWFVHRRLRPEEYGGRVHFKATGQRPYPVHPDVLNSRALLRVFQKYNTGFLPLAFPEGSPLHPAYGAGHATVAGACVTILKALFDENFAIPNPMLPDPNNPKLLVPYISPGLPLRVGGELNKLAANIALGRDHAGVHWRTDGIESLLLGEQLAISVLRDTKLTFNEPFTAFRFTGFDGHVIEV